MELEEIGHFWEYRYHISFVVKIKLSHTLDALLKLKSRTNFDDLTMEKHYFLCICAVLARKFLLCNPNKYHLLLPATQLKALTPVFAKVSNPSSAPCMDPLLPPRSNEPLTPKIPSLYLATTKVL